MRETVKPKSQKYAQKNAQKYALMNLPDSLFALIKK